MNWLKRWFHRNFLCQEDINERMRKMVIEAHQARLSENDQPPPQESA